MSGYHTILRMRRLEEEVAKLGFMFAYPKHRYGDEQDMVALKPLNDRALPIYSRDAELFCGTLEQLEVWLRGVQWSRDYDMLLKVSDEKRRDRKEQDVRNRQLVQLLKSEKVVQKS